MPRVDITLAQLTGAKLLTAKLDTNSVFWQVPLSNNFRLLNTLITPYGKFASTNSFWDAPEHFQQCMNEFL